MRGVLQRRPRLAGRVVDRRPGPRASARGSRAAWSASPASCVDGNEQMSRIAFWLSWSESRPSLTARPSSRPERRVLLRLVLLHRLDRRQHLLDQPLADQLDLPVLLQDLAGDVERQVVRVDDALDEAQVLGDERLAVVHDEHALDVELHAALGVAHEQVHRRVARQEQQRLVLERALGGQPDGLQRLAPVVADVPVELGVLLVGDLLLRARPQRLARVDASPVRRRRRRRRRAPSGSAR